MTRRVLVTGAQGFLGRHLIAQWLAAEPDIEIVGIGRSPRRADRFTHHVTWGKRRLRAPLTEALAVAERDPRYRYAAIDLLRGPALVGLLQEVRPDVIVHLAGELHDASPERLFATNVGGTIALLEAIAGSGVRPSRVVLGSTGGVYGHPLPSALPLREDAPCVPVDLYSVSKRAAEDAGRVLASRHGIPAVWARILNPVGPGLDEQHVCGRLAAQAAAILAGEIEPAIEVGPMNRTRDFIDARDVASALRLIASRGTPGAIYNVGSGVETSIEEVFACVLRLAGLDGAVRIDRRPDRPGDVMRHVADISRLRALGFEVGHPLASSLQDLLAYYRVTVAGAAVLDAASVRPPAPPALAVSVDARHEYAFTIARGLLATLPAALRGLFPHARMVLLDDSHVHGLHGARVLAAMRSAGIEVESITVPSGEASKSPERAREVIERMHEHRFDRRAVLVNLGGGVVTDLGGYVASTYMRGVAYVNVPTTLLAQHDSAIGGKVAVNAPWAKNFIGAFYHPRAVFCDPQVLITLPRRELCAGIAEAIKVALIDEPELFELLERDVRRVLAFDVDVLEEIVRRAAAKKIAILAPDPYEVDLRRTLNLGHTVGHALEAALGFENLLHGEAVAFGMLAATEVARARGVCSRRTADRIRAVLRAYHLPPVVSREHLEAARRGLDDIRLIRGGRLHFVLPERVGAVRIVDEVGDDEIDNALAAITAPVGVVEA